MKNKVILIIVIIFMCFTFYKSVNIKKNDFSKILENVIILKDGKIDKKNNNKIVLISGKIKFDENVTFDELENKVKTFKIERIVKEYIENENYEWKIRKEPKDILSEDFLDKIYSEEKITNINIGEFIIDNYGINQIKTNAYYNKQEKIKNLDKISHYYGIKENIKEPKLGDIKVEYKYFDIEKTQEISVLGKQKENKIVPFNIDEENIYYVFYDKIDSKEKLKEQLDIIEKNSIRGKIIFILLVFGIGLLLIKKEKNSESNI